MTSLTFDDSTTTNRMSVLVTALCNQPEAFGSDLGDDQSRYFFNYMISNPTRCEFRS